MSVILLDDACRDVGKTFFVLFFLNYTIAQSSVRDHSWPEKCGICATAILAAVN